MLRNVKTRCLSLLLILVTIVSMFSVTSALADASPDGLAIANSSITVYWTKYCVEGDVKGSIYANEGFSILVEESDYNSYYVHYSISSSPGWKDGYIKKTSDFTSYCNSTRGGQMLASSYVYYGDDSSTYGVVGSVDEGECVCVLAYSGNWYQIEYDTASGRKRGYVPQSIVTCFSSNGIHNPWYFEDFSSDDWCYLTTSHHIYAGETSLYNRIVSNFYTSSAIRVLSYQYGKGYYVEVGYGGSTIRGWIIDSTL